MAGQRWTHGSVVKMDRVYQKPARPRNTTAATANIAGHAQFEVALGANVLLPRNSWLSEEIPKSSCRFTRYNVGAALLPQRLIKAHFSHGQQLRVTFGNAFATRCLDLSRDQVNNKVGR